MDRLTTPLALGSRLRGGRRSARLRLTVLYGGMLVLAGVALVAATYVLFEQATAYKSPRLPKIPHAPVVGALPSPLLQAEQQLAEAQHQLALALPGNGVFRSAPHAVHTVPTGLALGSALPPLAQAQYQLAQVQQQLARSPNALLLPMQRLAQAQHRLADAARQLARAAPPLTIAQRQLAQAQHQLAQAVDQVAAAGSVQGAQRAVDSHQLLVNAGIALAIVAALALLAAWLAAGRILRPIRTITGTARRISSTNLHQRLALAGPDDELKQLGDTLDDLFARLEAAFEAQRRFVANASHELRTPLARERTLIQVALADSCTSAEVWRSTAEDLLASNREQETLVEALLTLASSEGGLDHRERTDLADICHIVLRHPGRDAHLLGLHIETAISPAPLDGDPVLVQRLVSNLVDNAIAHNIVGGRVCISSGVRDNRAVLRVSNTGPTVPPSELERLFQPFQRLDGRRNRHKDGHGLGLSIVQAIATAHGAAVAATAPPEGGLALEVLFPALGAPPLRTADDARSQPARAYLPGPRSEVGHGQPRLRAASQLE